MKIKKFNNGNINLSLEVSDKFYYNCSPLSYDDAMKESIKSINIDTIYNEVITMEDLYFNQINGYMYLIDYNSQKAYDFSVATFKGVNVLEYLKGLLIECYNDNKVLKLYPLSNKEYKSLMQDLENGY